MPVESTPQPGDVTQLNQDQAGAIALNFVQCLTLDHMLDQDVFYAGMTALFATTKISQPTPAQFRLATERLARIAPH